MRSEQQSRYAIGAGKQVFHRAVTTIGAPWRCNRLDIDACGRFLGRFGVP